MRLSVPDEEKIIERFRIFSEFGVPRFMLPIMRIFWSRRFVRAARWLAAGYVLFTLVLLVSIALLKGVPPVFVAAAVIIVPILLAGVWWVFFRNPYRRLVRIGRERPKTLG